MAQKKNFQELNLSNTFLFSAAMTDPEICQLVIGLSLDREIPRVTVNTEHTIMFSSDLRYVRLDVLASDDTGEIYNIEMENESTDRGQLPCLYVIFICTFDPFGKGFYRYTIPRRYRIP